MAPLEDARMILVVGDGSDANVQMNREIATVNYLMTAYPGHVFLCRGAFLLIELMHPRPTSQWGDFYVALLDRCDALYVIDDFRNHPLADWALENELPIIGDYLDLELFMSTPMRTG